MSKDHQETRPELSEVVRAVEKAHGKGAIMKLGDPSHLEPIPVIPTGSLALDEALGVGGYPRGRIVEIFGPESSGKTTLTLHAVAEVQAQGGVAAFIDAEHAFDLRYSQAIGVDLGRLLVAQPDDGEQALDVAEILAKSGGVDLIVIDSVAALVPRAELAGDMGDAHMGLQARLMSQATRKLTGVIGKTGTTLIFINQLRQKIGVVFGNPETTAGGQALKYYSSVRIDVRRVGKVSIGEAVIGNRTRAKVVKNKCAPPFTEAEFDIRWGRGIDGAADLLEVAQACGIIEKSGQHLMLEGKSLGNGRERARDAVLADEDLRRLLLMATVDSLPSKAGRDGSRPSLAKTGNGTNVAPTEAVA
ncbi:MAG: recombinase RecA [Polyangiaceae bacterium]|nr:recombinase RecA [Polyangiaceae bacterium]